jgi:hypothetical protein
MAMELVTQEMMDLSSVKQERVKIGHRNFVDLFDDPAVSEELKHNLAWKVAHFITLNGLTKAELQAMLRFIMEEFFHEVPAKPQFTVIEGKGNDSCPQS